MLALNSPISAVANSNMERIHKGSASQVDFIDPKKRYCVI